MYNAQETKATRAEIALELARYKMQVSVAQGYSPTLGDNDLNEIFVVAGLPLLQPGELKKEVNLINIGKEDYE